MCADHQLLMPRHTSEPDSASVTRHTNVVPGLWAKGRTTGQALETFDKLADRDSVGLFIARSWGVLNTLCEVSER